MMECSEKEVNICESSCDEDEDEEHATQKSEMEQARVRPLVFCPHCTQMVSNTTFYRHQGLYEQSEAESSSGESFFEQLHSTISNSVDQGTDCYDVEHQQVENELDSVDGMENVSYCSVCIYVCTPSRIKCLSLPYVDMTLHETTLS